MRFLNPAKLFRRIFIGIKCLIFLFDYLLIGFFQKRVLLLNYTGFEPHWGCQATSAALLNMIKRKQIGRVFLYPILYKKLRFRIEPDIKKVDLFAKEYLKRNMLMRMTMFLADYVIINGEGTIYEYTDWDKGTKPLELLLEAYIAKKIYEKTVLLINHSIDFLDGNPGSAFRDYVKGIYRQLDSIIVREPLSYRRLKELPVPRLIQAADAIFSFYPLKMKNDRKRLKGIGIKHGFIALFLRAGISQLPEEKIIQIAKYIKQEFNKETVFFPCSDDELQLAKDLQSKYGLKIMRFKGSSEKLVNILSRADCVLSGRFHCCVFSALARTPFIPFSSVTDKVEALLQQLAYPIEALDFYKSSQREVIDRLRYALDNQHELRETFDIQLPKLRYLALKNIP